MNLSRCGENLKEKEDELFFVEVKAPNEVRRNILESLKKILEMLQRFEKFKAIRHKKIEHIQKLRVLLKEANKTIGNLKSKLPQTNLRAIVVKDISNQVKKVHHAKGKKEKQAEEKKAPKREMTEIEKLESELSSIEGKLKGLA